MSVDPWILTFSLVTVVVTIAMGFWSAKKSKTASDFFVAGRSVSVGWNASAISGEYLSAASFMGVAGMVMSSGYDALWYPVCYACGYLFLLLFIAGPLRRFGAYTIPDFAEGRYDSPVFRKIAVIFVLFIGFFYTMPQMKGAGTTLAYIFPGLPYWAGVVLVGAVITLNVALGGMKGITLVQAFQYWAKMFAISVPIFVLMSVYGHYGKQLDLNGKPQPQISESVLTNSLQFTAYVPADKDRGNWLTGVKASKAKDTQQPLHEAGKFLESKFQLNPPSDSGSQVSLEDLAFKLTLFTDGYVFLSPRTSAADKWPENYSFTWRGDNDYVAKWREMLARHGMSLVEGTTHNYYLMTAEELKSLPATTTTSVRKPLPEKAPADQKWISPFGPLTTKAATKANLKADEAKPLSLLYTYSLIIALVCGTAGLPHILVRFYTNPDGVAAKRTTMWVMILIGVFYVFPPVFGVMGRNLFPDLYAGTGAKGTDKIVLELPRLLNERVPMLGSILSGIACAGAFAAFMSTFSGLLVSMTGAMAHDVYGKMLRPKSSPEQRMKMFKVFAVLIGAVAIVLGSQVEQLEINFMVGQAFAIAAASYFPLLFMSVWWRGMTQKGAATGMLTGGLLALGCITLTSVSDLALKAAQKSGGPNSLQGLENFWIAHPAIRILCEQPAIWAVPLAIVLMIVISKLTRSEVPSDIRMKMLVLHAPEQLGLKQEYIQEHSVPGH